MLHIEYLSYSWLHGLPYIFRILKFAFSLSLFFSLTILRGLGAFVYRPCDVFGLDVAYGAHLITT